MNILRLNDVDLHWREDGDPKGAPVVFSNSLGTDLRLWDKIIPLMPEGLRLIRYDKRGHGLSSCPPAPYSMGALIHDAERLMDHLGVTESLFVGLSIGGQTAQGLAVKRPELIRAMVLSNTGAKLGTHQIWQDRIDTTLNNGIEALADAVMERWFGKDFLGTDEMQAWRNLLVRTPAQGYAGCSAAIQNTDFYTTTASLRLPTLGIAGSEDGASPPDLVRETVDLIPGSKFHLIRRAGHLPCVEKPQEYAEVLTRFIREVGHV